MPREAEDACPDAVAHKVNAGVVAVLRAHLLMSARNAPAARAALADAEHVGNGDGTAPLLADWIAVTKSALHLTAQHEAIVKPKPQRENPAPDTGAVTPMTPREAAVLRYLPTRLTRDDIAKELSLSPNTVKVHIRGIYHKLGATGRREAVDRARALGLLG